MEVPKLASVNIEASVSPEHNLWTSTQKKEENIHICAFKGVSGCRRRWQVLVLRTGGLCPT